MGVASVPLAGSLAVRDATTLHLLYYTCIWRLEGMYMLWGDDPVPSGSIDTWATKESDAYRLKPLAARRGRGVVES